MKKHNKKRVFIQYPWKTIDSPYYKYLVTNPPENIEYINSTNQKGVITNTRKFLFSNNLKKIARKTIKGLNLPLVNAHYTKTKQEYDIIHNAHCLSLNKDKPWICDFESRYQMWISGEGTKKEIEKALKILMRKNCKKILAWTNSTKEKLIETFPEIKDKIEVVYPAIPLNKQSQKNKNKITILYATRYFWLKGGLIALEVYKRLKEKYGELELIFISDVPNEVKLRYQEIKIQDLVSNKELFKLYEKSDIFFYPSLMDSFGFGLLEAMSFGIPIVTVNTKHTATRKEIVENDVNGLIFDVNDEMCDKLINQKEKVVIQAEEEKIINQLVENCSKLIENKKIREKMSKNCIKIIKDGKFSIKERNKKLKRIYEEAVNEN